MTALPTASWAVRIAGIIALGLGAVIFVSPGVLDALRPVHMLVGLVVMVGLLLLARLGLRAGVPVLPYVAVAWAIVLPIFGVTQESITLLPRIAIQAGHLAVGVVAIGLGEMLSIRISRPKRAMAQAR